MTARDDQLAARPLAGGDTHAPAQIGYPREEELVGQLRARSVSAWERLFEDHFDRLYRYALARVRSPEAAEDVAATTFDRALTTIDRYSYRGLPALAWLYGIARNVVNETRRRDKRQHASEVVEYSSHRYDGDRPSAALLPLQADIIEGLASRMDLERAMRCLTQVQREVVVLRYFAGLSAYETGQVIGRPETAVYALQARALAALRRQLAV